MAYTADPTNDSQPTEDISLETAAAEFRALKRYVRGDLLQGILNAQAQVSTLAAEVLDAYNRAEELLGYAGLWTAQTGAAAIPTTVTHAGKTWKLNTAVADITAHTPGVSVVWTDASANSATITHGTGTVASALKLALTGLANKVINHNFAGNSRQLSGSIVLAANARGHDCWQAGAAGCSLTVSAGVATITAGAYKYTIDGATIDATGDHVISWAGTAQCSINGGAAVSSPAVVSLTAGTNATLQFGLGTVDSIVCEEGVVPSGIPKIHPSVQRMLLDWYIKQEYVLIGNSNARLWISGRSSTALFRPETRIEAMRVVPAVEMLNNNTIQYLNAASTWTATTLTVACYGTPQSLLFYATLGADAAGVGAYVRRAAVGDVIAVLSAEL